jgi:hypothetical protein
LREQNPRKIKFENKNKKNDSIKNKKQLKK